MCPGAIIENQEIDVVAIVKSANKRVWWIVTVLNDFDLPEGHWRIFLIINHVQLQKMTEPKAFPICLMLIMQTEWRWRCNGSLARFVLINYYHQNNGYISTIIKKKSNTFKKTNTNIFEKAGYYLRETKKVFRPLFSYLAALNGSTITHLAVSLIFCRKETHRQRYWLCTKSIIPGECGKDYHFDRRIPLI